MDASDQPAAQRQQSAAFRVRQEAVVANALEAARQYVQQEATQELGEVERQQPLLVAMGRIAPAERDLLLLERDQALIRDRHTVGVAAQILQRPPSSSEGRPYFEHPLVAVERPHKGLEVVRSIQRREPPVETQLAFEEGLPETVHELTAENLGEDVLRQEEALRRRVDPTAVVKRKPPGGNDRMDVGVFLESLIPGMQDREEADLGAEMARIASDFEQRLCARSQQQRVDRILVL